MSWNSVLADMQTILNRDDCSAAQAAVFLTQGVQRIQRECRLPSMERTLIIQPAGQMTFFPVPVDLLQPIDVLWVPGSTSTYAGAPQRPLKKCPYRDLVRMINPNANPMPAWYARNQTQIWLWGNPVSGDTVNFLYYGNFTPWANGNADNELSASAPDLMIYAGLSYAGDYFVHPLTQQWEQRYQAIRTSYQQMGDDLDAEGGPQAIQPLYSWND